MSGSKFRSILFSAFFVLATPPLTFGQKDTAKGQGSKDQSTEPAPLSPKSSVPVNPPNASKAQESGEAPAPVLSPKSSVPVQHSSAETAGPNREKPVPTFSSKATVPVKQGRPPAQDTNAKHHKHG